MTLEQFRDVLLTVTDEVYHFESHKQAEYVVWHEVGRISISGDDSSAESGTRIAVDYFTKDEYSSLPEQFTTVLSSCDDIAVRGPVVIFEGATKLIHYAWTCEVV